ncbi:2-dehydropantoate 2-reductase [soil metagenome]
MSVPLDICVVGAGAIGGSLAVRMAVAGARVTVVARGAHAHAIRDRGLSLLSGEDRQTLRLPCVAQLHDVPPQDVAVVAVKARDLVPLAPALAGLLKPGGRIVFAMNGIPWWFGLTPGLRFPDVLQAVLDPGEALSRHVPLQTVIGAVVQFSAEVIAPGVVRGVANGRHGIVLGRAVGPCDGDSTLARFTALLGAAGLEVRVRDDIRPEIWTKTLLSTSAGCVAALTGADLGVITEDADGFALLSRLMAEGLAIGRALGLPVQEDADARLRFYRGKSVRPSMLQDMEAGRALEIDGGLLAFARIAETLRVDAPCTQAVAALIRLKDATARRARG